MKLQFFDALSSCRGGELLGVIQTSRNATHLVILKENGDIETFDIDYIHKCKVVTEEPTQEKKHR
jgi:hypothetical protein